MTFGARVKEKRIQLGLTQKDIAAKIHATQTTVNKIEQDKSGSSKFILPLAKALQTTPEYLLYGVSSEIPAGKVPLLEWHEAVLWCLGKEGQVSLSASRRYETNPNPQADNKRAFALRIKNDAMISAEAQSASFPIGSLIVADPDLRPTEGGYILGVWEGKTEPVLRQYIIEGGASFLKPLNGRYPIQEWTDSFVFLAVVTAQMHLLYQAT